MQVISFFMLAYPQLWEKPPKISHLQDKVQGKIFHAKAGEEPSVAEALNSLSMYRKVMEIGQGRTGVRQELEDADAIVKQMGERLQ